MASSYVGQGSTGSTTCMSPRSSPLVARGVRSTTGAAALERSGTRPRPRGGPRAARAEGRRGVAGRLGAAQGGACVRARAPARPATAAGRYGAGARHQRRRGARAAAAGAPAADAVRLRLSFLSRHRDARRSRAARRARPRSRYDAAAFIVLFEHGWPAGGYERRADVCGAGRPSGASIRDRRGGAGYRVYAKRNDP